MHIRPSSAAVALIIVFALASATPGQEVIKSMTPINGQANSKSELSYRKKWAVIIGINYNPEDRKPLSAGTIPPLSKAETDAASFAELLKRCFGYRNDEVVLLLGKNATKKEIEEKLQNSFLCDPDKVKPEDSVLFYYSGHGFLRRNSADEAGEGYLIPFDVKTLANDDPDLAGAIDSGALLVKNLRDHCPARHKLLLLDCCHSGSVFNFSEGIAGARSPDERKDASLFQSPAFQAITASRATQVASDGAVQSEHSPVTTAILRAMTTIPQGHWDDANSFRACDLFHEMQTYLQGALPDYQSPQFRRLDNRHDGEFHFFPVRSASFAPSELTDDDRKMFLASIPSTFGNWWGDENLWFMPSFASNY